MADADAILKRLETLNAIGAALSSERDIRALLEQILEAAQSFANADGGTLYLVDGKRLRFEVIRNETLGYRMGGRSGVSINFPTVPLYDDEGNPILEGKFFFSGIEDTTHMTWGQLALRYWGKAVEPVKEGRKTVE